MEYTNEEISQVLTDIGVESYEAAANGEEGGFLFKIIQNKIRDQMSYEQLVQATSVWVGTITIQSIESLNENTTHKRHSWLSRVYNTIFGRRRRDRSQRG